MPLRNEHVCAFILPFPAWILETETCPRGLQQYPPSLPALQPLIFPKQDPKSLASSDFVQHAFPLPPASLLLLFSITLLPKTRQGAGDKDGAHPDGSAPPMRPPAWGSYASPLALSRCSANAHGVSLERRLFLNLLRAAGQAPLGSAPSCLLPETTSACQSGSF